MTDVTLRATKGSPLTHTEMDNNQVATRSGRKNMIIGGNFDTNPWQRGTTFSPVVDNDFHADRFRWDQVGSGVVDVLKAATAPSVAQAGVVVSNCLSIDVTTADASIAAGDVYFMRSTIEGYDWAQIAQNDFVVSFWHRHTKTGTYCISLSNSGSDRSYVAEYTQSVGDTWEKATIKVTASPSAGTWNYTNGHGLKVSFTVASGTTYHTTADTWQTGNFSATSSQVNAMDSASNFMRFALIQVEEGIEATDFERRHYADELALCQRYYLDIAPSALMQYNRDTAGANKHTAYSFPVTMRAIPTCVATVTTGTVSYTRISEWRVDVGTDNTSTSAQVATANFTADAEL